MKFFGYSFLLISVYCFYCSTATAQSKPVSKPKTITVTAKPATATPAAKEGQVTKTVTIQKPVSGVGITNGIKLNAKGIVVKEAFLLFDDGSRVPETNKIDINQTVNLRLILAGGFKEVAGKVFPGGSEKIMLSNGEVKLESADLYPSTDSVGASPVDARYITLKAIITDIKDKSNDVLVSFKVWDKKSEWNTLSGSYILHIK